MNIMQMANGKKMTSAKPTMKLHEVGVGGNTTTSWILLVVVGRANFSCTRKMKSLVSV
jgi:hypothetical protein